MVVLGISAYSHESSCAILRDGKVIAHAEEERFNRERHTWKFPRNAIAYCLEQSGVSLEQVDHICFFWDPQKEVWGNLKHVLRYFPSSLNLLRGPSGGSLLSFSERRRAIKNVGLQLRKDFQLKATPTVHFIEHHLAHAASCFFVSPFPDSAILTMDGRGESTSTLLAYGERNKIEKLAEIAVPHSIGHFYASVTDYLGFKPFFDEWKVMGLSAYGMPTYLEEFRKLISLDSRNLFRLNLDFFQFHTHGQKKCLSELFVDKFGPIYLPGCEPDQRAADISFALQTVVEEAGLHLANELFTRTKSANLCITGGASLNCLMNSKIVKASKFQNFFFQPIANDAGTSLGAALYYNHHELNLPRAAHFDSVFLGPSFSNAEIETLLRTKKVSYHFCENIAAEAAKEIAEGKITGWFQGRMESGPRALGNRSILADPTRSDMKDRLNQRVKRRETFRPFAPSVMEERAEEFFRLPRNSKSPFMMLVGDVREEKRALLPAVTHKDGTARVQTVSKSTNEKFWNLLQEFEKLRGVPVLLNTSFNENEPIVCNPEQALNCFLRTDFDVLAIGDFLVKKI